jgi:hypothetical protein
MMMRRRMGAPLLRTAVVAGGAYAVGHNAAQNAAREQEQSAQIADMQAQQDQMAQQMANQQQAQQMAQMQQMPQAAPPPQYAPPPPPQAAPPQAAPAAAAPSQSDKLAQLQQLGELKAAGVLTEEEFQAEKAKILNS